MSRLRVREFATELNLGNKEILQILRDLGIQVKSHMSTLTEEEAQTVRDRITGTAAVTEVTRKEIQPGMIVRRRRRTLAPEPSAEGEAEIEAGAGEAAEVEEELLAAPAAEPEEAEAMEPAEEAEEIAAQAAFEVEQAEEAAFEAETPEEAVAEEAAPAEEAQAAPEAGAEARVEAGEPAPVGETEAEAALARKKKGKKKEKEKEKFTGPQVRVISRPVEQPAPPPPPPGARPEPTPGPRVLSRPPAPQPGAYQPGAPRPGAPRPGEQRPGAPRPGDQRPGAPRPAGYRPAGPRPGFAPPAPQAPTEEAGDRKKKRKKDKRVVEFGASPAFDQTGAAGKKRMAEDVRDLRGKLRKKKPRGAEAAQLLAGGTQPMKAAKRKVKVDEAIRVSDLAQSMGVKAPEIIRVLMGMGVLATINQSLDMETATLVASEFGYEVEKTGFSEAEFLLPAASDKPEDLKSRPPVVTIMGHVDHGKTSLLDAIRQTSVTLGEAGGITQHIGAYHVATNRGEVVFLDTPGHEAFTAMRARGAQVTDLVVLVVAADDGVMDQTREAVNHARAANVPILVAVNKIDKEDANPDRVRRELADMGLMSEDWGGETIFAHVSAKKRLGIDELLELILLQAEVLELKANPDKPARGHIVEAKLDKGRGPLGTVLIAEGTLHVNDIFVCGMFHGKVRALFNDQGKKIKSAGPAMPVEVQGFEGVPEAGDEFICVADEKVARRIAEDRRMKQRERELAKESRVTLESFLKAKADQEVKHLNIVLKADVQGSLEAIAEALRKTSTDQVKIDLIHLGAGAITESDVMLASASEAIVIGFNVRPTPKVKEVADREKVEIRFYDIIYKLVGEVKDAMTGMLAPVVSERYLGQAEVRQTFMVSRVGTVAGCGVNDGKITRNAKIRLVRDGVVVYTGELSSLKRFKDDVREVTKGYECGITLANFNDIKVGDTIEAFEMVEEKATLE